MDFRFLLDPDRKLLSIGFSVATNRLDTNCYDLLASEARLASLFAIAKGDVETRHWFRLGRPATPIGSGSALISWSGSMFEYLMPSLVMRAPAGSVLEQTTRLVVARQRSYAAGLGIPWGISESSYNARDLEMTYQYSNFGVPGLGLKRGLSENRVIAPYATGLAAMIDPVAAVQNYAALARPRCRGTLRVLRGGRFHAVARAVRRDAGHRPQLHGAPSGHDDHRHRQHLAEWPSARPVSCRTDDPGRRASAARTYPPRRCQRPAARNRSAGRPGRAARCSRRPDLREPGDRASDGASSVQRQLWRDADRDGRRLQPLARPGDHALAGRSGAGRAWLVPLPARHGLGRGLVRRRPADAGRVRPPPRRLLRTPCRLHPPDAAADDH